VGVLTPARQRSPQHSELTAQDWRRGLQGAPPEPPPEPPEPGFPRASRVSPPGAAAANVTKATARRMVDLKNCMVASLKI
jgi:hypothetical protein